MEQQTLKQKTELLAICALMHEGTSKSAQITKRVIAMRYRYTKYWFDFTSHAVLIDKQEKDKCVGDLSLELRIDDNLLVVTATSRMGRLKVLTQMNITSVTMNDTTIVVDSPTLYLEVPRK